MRTFAITIMLVLLADCSPATTVSISTNLPRATVTPFPYLPPTIFTPISPIMPSSASRITLKSVPGFYGSVQFPSFSASTRDTATIQEFIQDASSLKSIIYEGCPVGSGYAISIALWNASGKIVWIGQAFMDGCRVLEVGSDNFYVTSQV